MSFTPSLTSLQHPLEALARNLVGISDSVLTLIPSRTVSNTCHFYSPSTCRPVRSHCQGHPPLA